MNDFLTAMLVETIMPFCCIALIIVMTRVTRNIFNFFNFFGLSMLILILFFGITQGIYADIPNYLNKESTIIEGKPYNLHLKNYSDRYGEHTDFEFTINNHSFRIPKTEMNISEDKTYKIEFLPNSKMIINILEK